jgi:hypothetical protein
LASTSERRVLGSIDLHESTKTDLELLYRKNTQAFADEIKFMKGRLIGLVEGNHYAELPSGITTTQLLAEKMDCKYLGVSAFIRLVFKDPGNHSFKVDIWAHHGLGGGRTQGASINKLEQMIKAAHADIYLMGHDHKKHIAMQSRLELTDSKKHVRLHNKKILMARTGGFLRGYENNIKSYIAEGAFSPTDIGCITIKLTPSRSCKEKVDDRWMDISASL